MERVTQKQVIATRIRATTQRFVDDGYLPNPISNRSRTDPPTASPTATSTTNPTVGLNSAGLFQSRLELSIKIRQNGQPEKRLRKHLT